MDQSNAPVALAEQDATTPAVPEARTFQMPENVTLQAFEAYTEQTEGNGGSLSHSASGNQRATELRFYDDGSSDGARIVLVSSEGLEATLEVAALTGHASLMPDDTMGSTNATHR